LLLALKLHRRITPQAVIIALTVASFIYGVVAAEISLKHGFYMPMSRMWEISAGGCIAIFERARPTERAWSSLIGGFGLAVIGGVVYSFGEIPRFPGWAVLVPVLGTALVITAGILGGGPETRFLASRPMVFIGRLSYTIYLVHWPIIVYWRMIVGRELDLPEKAMIAGLSVLLSFAIWKLIEQPLRMRPTGEAGATGADAGVGRKVLVGIASAGVLCGGLAAGLALSKGAPQRLNATALASAASLTKHKRVKGRSRCTRRPKWTDAKIRSRLCRFGPADKVEFVIIGDSHAGMYSRQLAAALMKAGLRGGVYKGMVGCPPLFDISMAARKNVRKCPIIMDAIRSAIKRDRPKLVILAARWANLASELPAPSDGRRSKKILDRKGGLKEISLQRALIRTIRTLEASGASVVVIGPSPEVSFNVPNALVRFLQWGYAMPSAARDQFDRRQRLVLAAIEAAKAQTSAKVVYPHEILCDKQACKTRDGVVSLYRDDDHLSRPGVKLVVEKLITVLKSGPAG
jgi:hypothetical protein